MANSPCERENDKQRLTGRESESKSECVRERKKEREKEREMRIVCRKF